ncbi:cytochrome C [Roseovarius sp. SCSIO 43702]|uniref:c-type cytochrome n=1 Tax=Roseovarius sp. SCSIO 43702 TaxID=2823043 RepID=UPI001C73D634|nr:cytochrome C [Roseovarius sp. SCSIO 43702]QYX56655.1 cytochrome C [Roseovarius sp. SCSIO 43702]
MKHLIAPTLAALAFALPAHAEGDADKGEKTFNRCKSCHAIADGDEDIVKGGRTGPNLYGIIGSTAGTVEDFSGYGDSLVAAGEAGLVWDEENLAEYVKDPRGFLKDYLDDDGAKSKMTFKLNKGGEDVAAYLATFSADEDGDSDSEEGASEDAEGSDAS